MLAPDRVRIPTPAFVKVTPVPAMMPSIEPAPLLVIEMALLLAKVIAWAVKVAVLMVRPVNGVPPIVPVKVVSPVVVVDKVFAPATVELKRILPALEPVVSTLAPPKVTAPV